MKAKASNTTYAAKYLKKYLEEKNIPLERVILSNFDCDTCVHPEYFAALTFRYITDPKQIAVCLSAAADVSQQYLGHERVCADHRHGFKFLAYG